MSRKVKTLSSAGLTIAILLFALFFIFTAEVGAKSEVSAIDGINYNVQAGIGDNLKAFIGKKVTVTLDSGTSFSGFVKKVGDNLVHLEKLDGKEFFDVLIRIERISAIEAQFRKY